jgi:hypothetical protein
MQWPTLKGKVIGVPCVVEIHSKATKVLPEMKSEESKSVSDLTNRNHKKGFPKR